MFSKIEEVPASFFQKLKKKIFSTSPTSSVLFQTWDFLRI